MPVGLARFADNGAKVLQPVLALNDAHKAALEASVNGIGALGGTPLAESFHTLGKYFVGSYNGDLTLHPDGVPEVKSASTVFHASPEIASGITAPSPITSGEWCQQNFIVALTDGQPSGDRDINSDSGLTDYDGDCSGPDANCLSYDRKVGGGYNYDSGGSGGSDYMDDVVLALRDIDLRPDVDDHNGNEVKNNVKTFMLGLADPLIKADPLFDNTAVAGGGGQPYFVDDGNQLLVAFEQVMSEVHAQSGSVASVAFNSSQLSSDSAVFQAIFNTGRWSGSLLAWALSDTGVIANTPAWNVADKLDAQEATDRKIMTRNATDGIEFTVANWDTLTNDQKNDLGYDGDGTRDDTRGAMILNYLRGDRTNEGSAADKLRIRNGVLGDIVNSTPVFVGAPELNWPDYSVNSKFGSSTATYATFKDGAAKDRTEVIYAGANDGMLHGFNGSVTEAAGGQEVLAYIPSALFSDSANDGLHYLADRLYGHQFYVDLTPSVSDVFIKGSTDGSAAWRTVLIGGLGAGGKGLFALDVTDPTKFQNLEANAAAISLWEFTSTDDGDLGYTFSQPTIAMMQNGKWAAIVGNGYNNSGDGKAKLFILFLEGGLDGGWTENVDYIEIDTGVGSPGTPNGLSTPRVVDLDGDSVADRVYAGDLQGNMWAFDVSGASGWGSAYSASGSPRPLFSAKDSTGGTAKAQPITAAPIIAKNSNVFSDATNYPNLLVLFGTGKFLESSDVSSEDQMSYYGVWDANTGQLTRSNLASRTLTTSGSTRTISGSPIDWIGGEGGAGRQYGWYFDLASNGERVVSDSQLRRDVLFFNTIAPSGVTCGSGGTGWLMSLQYDTGLAPPHGVFDANNDGVIDMDDQGKVGYLFDAGLPAKSGMLGEKQYTPGSDGSITEREIDVGAGAKEGRLSWEEIFNQ